MPAIKGKKQTPETIEARRRGLMGHKVSEEARIKIGLGQKGKVVSVDTREKIRKNMLGIKRSEETRNKIVKGNLGKHFIKHTEETKLKIKENCKGHKNHLGHKHTDVTKQLLREKRMLQVFPVDYREKMSKMMKQRHKDNPEYSRKFNKAGRSKHSNTTIEVKIQKFLESMGIPFIKDTDSNMPHIKGHPDILIYPNILIFADGTYHHADPRIHGADSKIYNKTAREVWDYNNNITKFLEFQGYKVLRFWMIDIDNNFDVVRLKILKTLGF